MGLYDRDYGRDEPTPWERAQNPRSVTITLIVINVIVFVVAMVLRQPIRDELTGNMFYRSPIHEWFAVNSMTLPRPWMWWQCLTYGFVHDYNSIMHLLFNMIGLFFFGRPVEQRLGQKEFLRFYLAAIVLGGIVAAITSFLMAPAAVIGASGGVVATVILFACFYPQAELLLMFVIPMKAWVLAVLFVGIDLFGAFGVLAGMGHESNTAFTVHLTGAAFALAYYFQHWNLRWLNLDAIAHLPERLRQRSRRMKLKIHDPDKKIERDAIEADRILAKIHRSGEASLTAAERKTLERYSRHQREKRRD